MKLHIFTEDGINEFRKSLFFIKSGVTNELNKDELFSSYNSKKYEIDVDLPDFRQPISKYNFIVNLANALKLIEIRKEFCYSG